MSILRWLMSVLLFVGRLLVSVVDGIIWTLKLMVKIVQWGALIAGSVLILLIPVAVVYGLFTDTGEVLMSIIALLGVGFIVFLIGGDESPAGYGLSLAATTFYIHISVFDTFLKYSKGDVGLAWLILILASTLVIWIIKAIWWTFGMHKMGKLTLRNLQEFRNRYELLKRR